MKHFCGLFVPFLLDGFIITAGQVLYRTCAGGGYNALVGVPHYQN